MVFVCSAIMARVLLIPMISCWILPAMAQERVARWVPEADQTQGLRAERHRVQSGQEKDGRAPSNTGNAAQLVGTWQGIGIQIPAVESNREYPITMIITGAGGSIDYPSLHCGGTLTNTAENVMDILFREHITYGNCIDGGFIYMHRYQEYLSWTWYGGDDGETTRVFAILRRGREARLP